MRFRVEKEALMRSLYKLLDPQTVNRALIGGTSPSPPGGAGHAVGILEALIAATTGGIGPNNSGYAAYSDDYAAKKQSAGSMRWLRGAKNSGRSGGMLDPARFRFSATDGSLWLVWTAENSRMGIYAEVHQDGINPKVPQRKWMTFHRTNCANAILKAYQETIDEMIAEWNSRD